MSQILAYVKPGPAGFDFRVQDGLGNCVYPDWDESFKIEFLDVDCKLQFTATIASSPALEKGDDYYEMELPEGGPFVEVDGIDLANFPLGRVEARVYTRVDGVDVLPSPTVLAAFEVVEKEAEVDPYE